MSHHVLKSSSPFSFFLCPGLPSTLLSTFSILPFPNFSLSGSLQNYFFRLARLDGKYFLCDTERLIKNATLLQNTSMSLKDLYVFCRTPIDMRGPFTGWAMLKVTLCCRHPFSPPSPPPKFDQAVHVYCAICRYNYSGSI